MKPEGNKEYLAYVQANEKYLTVGRRYSTLLSQMMKLDPDILRIAEEILSTGDGLSTYDNKFLTAFYTDLRQKSKINKKYYDFLLNLKKTRMDLDRAVRDLSKARIGYLLRKSGIPPRRTNAGRDIIARQINNPDISLLEKISLPEILDIRSAEGIDSLMASGDLTLNAGTFVPKTRDARHFIKNLDLNIKQSVNNQYFSGENSDLLRAFGNLDTKNILDFVRLAGDRDHIREIERKIEAGDIRLTEDGLMAVGQKGTRYLALLMEELTGQYEKKLNNLLLTRNQEHTKNDPRLTAVRTSLKDLDITLDRHANVGRMVDAGSPFHDFLKKSQDSRDRAGELLAKLLTLQETISVSFVDIKKQIVATLDRENLDIDKIISLIVAVRYLSLYEKDYEASLTSLEHILGVTPVNSSSVSAGPISLTRLSEKYQGESQEFDEEANQILRSLIGSRLNGRKDLGSKTSETLTAFLLTSPGHREYKSILSTQRVAKKHIVDTLYASNCLYSGLGNISEILSEITELELQKKEKLADLAHELELDHKELWLANIKNKNKEYIDTNFETLPQETREKARIANAVAISSARKEIRDTLEKYRSEHRAHSEEFGTTLRESLKQITKGGDVTKISTDLKKEYKKMSSNHDELISKMEKDILKLEKRLTDFEAGTPAEIEKILMTDIRASI